jgi:RND family efflux transporter MFP subunit
MSEFTVKNRQNALFRAARLPPRNDKEMRKLLIFGILAASVAAVIVMTSMRPAPPKKERVELDPLVEVIVLEEMTANFEVRSQGTVRPRTETILSAEVSGTITEMSPKFVAGGVFKRNEVLARIDPTNYDVAFKQAEAMVELRQIEYDGAKKLRNQGYRAEAEFASAAAALATARAELVRARRNLERTYIRLPYEGIVRSKESDLGQFVNPGTRLGVVFATDFAEVRLPLTDADLAFVDLPNTSDVTSTGSVEGPSVILTAVQKGRPVKWAASIVRTEGVVDEKSRVTYAVARVADPYRLHADGEELPVGTFVSAIIQGGAAENVVRVPRTLLRGSNELVFVDEENKLRIRSVGIVRADSRFVYIGEGAKSGDRIVVTALETPVNGATVRTADDTSSDPIVVSGGGE